MICPDCGFERAQNITIKWVTGDEEFIDCPCHLVVPHKLTYHSFASMIDFPGLKGLSKKGNILIGPPGVGKTHLICALRNFFHYYIHGQFLSFGRIAEELLRFEPEMYQFDSLKLLDEFDSPDRNSHSAVLDRWLCNRVENGNIWISSNLSLDVIKEEYSPRLADRLRTHAIHMSGNSLRGTERQINGYKQKRLWHYQWQQYKEEMNKRDQEKIMKKIKGGEPLSTGELLILDIGPRSKYLREMRAKN